MLAVEAWKFLYVEGSEVLAMRWTGRKSLRDMWDGRRGAWAVTREEIRLNTLGRRLRCGWAGNGRLKMQDSHGK